jgi:hypothetical protein
MKKSFSRELLEYYLKDHTPPIVDAVVYLNRDGQGNITQWTFIGLLCVAYDLTPKQDGDTQDFPMTKEDCKSVLSRNTSKPHWHDPDKIAVTDIGGNGEWTFKELICAAYDLKPNK